MMDGDQIGLCRVFGGKVIYIYIQNILYIYILILDD